jgi:hypothetical protein
MRKVLKLNLRLTNLQAGVESGQGKCYMWWSPFWKVISIKFKVFLFSEVLNAFKSESLWFTIPRKHEKWVVQKENGRL